MQKSEPKPPVYGESSSNFTEVLGINDENTYVMLMHLSPLLHYVLPIPGANIICPLILWKMKDKESSFVDEQGKEALNFQITIAIALLISFASIFVFVGVVLFPAVLVLQAVFCVLAGLAVKDGQPYRYPMTIRFIS